MLKKNVIKNIILLYGFSIAKIVFPLVTLPYLTRVLSVDSYGVVAYVKTVMTYMQLIVDFGFLYSGTKDIVEVSKKGENISEVTSSIFFARLLLSILSFISLIILSFFLNILKDNILYTFLSFITVFLSNFLFDYLFRGIEKMHIITSRFMLMKGLSTIFTFVVVHNDKDILWIPILDVLGSILAIILVFYELKKLHIVIKMIPINVAEKKKKTSAIYFASDMATTAFGALNTVIIGALLSKKDVAFWSICMQLVAAVQAMYTPITNGVYPDMVRNKDLNQIYKLLKIFMPIIILGSIFTFFMSPYILEIIGGSKYISASVLLKYLIPIFIFSFPGMLFGWPSLGAIGRAKQVTISTVFSALVQVLGLLLLWFFNFFSLLPIAVLRCATEFVLFALRFYFCMKYKSDFSLIKSERIING